MSSPAPSSSFLRRLLRLPSCFLSLPFSSLLQPGIMETNTIALGCLSHARTPPSSISGRFRRARACRGDGDASSRLPRLFLDSYTFSPTLPLPLPHTHVATSSSTTVNRSSPSLLTCIYIPLLISHSPSQYSHSSSPSSATKKPRRSLPELSLADEDA